MNMADRAVCIIPARGGSKRLPGKNIRPFRGRPMVCWSITAARASGLFDTVMVSTDDSKIAETARAAGADVPFLRSAASAGDHATTPDVLHEVLMRYKQIDEHFDLACCLYPTAPFVESADLEQGHRLLVENGFDVVMPIATFSYPIWRSLYRDADGRVHLNFPEYLNARSQDVPAAYHDAGQWYWFRINAFLRDGVLMGENTGTVVLSPVRVQDIDTEEDWFIAELKHERIFG